jgi:cytochrome c6
LLVLPGEKVRGSRPVLRIRRNDVKRILVLIALLALLLAPVLAEGDGKALYDKKCGLCHGKDGVAKKMATGSANLNDAEWQKGATIEGIEKNIVEGKGKMPKFAEKLSPEEIKAIAEYVKTLK